jgi:hypothetical protein
MFVSRSSQSRSLNVRLAETSFPRDRLRCGFRYSTKHEPPRTRGAKLNIPTANSGRRFVLLEQS